MRVFEIKLVAHSGPPPFCGWCGKLIRAGSSHGQIETDEKTGLATVRCVLMEFKDLENERA